MYEVVQLGALALRPVHEVVPVNPQMWVQITLHSDAGGSRHASHSFPSAHFESSLVGRPKVAGPGTTTRRAHKHANDHAVDMGMKLPARDHEHHVAEPEKQR
jgi:hypothetical protein